MEQEERKDIEMTEEYEWKDFADDAVQEIEGFIDTESQFIKAEHRLLSSLLSIDYIFAHLDEIIPDEHPKLHEVMAEISNILAEIKNLIESDESRDLKFEQEEKKLLDIFEYDLQHKNWRAVRRIKDAEEKLEIDAVRLREEELKQFHSIFENIKKLISKINLDEVDEKIRHYLKKLIKILRAYERIFWHLLRKEIILERKLSA